MIADRAPRPDAAPAPRGSRMAEGMLGSAILKVAGEVRALTAQGRQICNLTVGDFAPREFEIPAVLRRGIQEALERGETNYPPSAGLPVLRDAIRMFYRDWLGLDYAADSVLVTGGARPAIYAMYRTLVDPGDRVVYNVPSWNNNYYCQLVGAEGVPVSCGPEIAFLPTRAMLDPVIRGARLLALNSPLNPTGTAFDADTLADICDLVLEENARRSAGERPLYFLYDQVYWMLTFGGIEHVTPLALRPALAPYTIVVDAISKSFAATGLRVGWALGPADVIRYMSDFIGHVGAWAPRPEQVATATLLGAREAITEYQDAIRRGVEARLDTLYRGIIAMRDRGLPVDAIPPAGAIYLSARAALAGARTPGGKILRTNEEIRRYLLEAADLAVVPFQAFGVREDTGWFRLSVGAVSVADIERVLPKLAAAVEAASAPAPSRVAQ